MSSPAVVEQVRWKDGNEDVLPVHGEEHSVTRVYAGRKLNEHTKRVVIRWLYIRGLNDVIQTHCAEFTAVDENASLKQHAGVKLQKIPNVHCNHQLGQIPLIHTHTHIDT